MSAPRRLAALHSCSVVEKATLPPSTTGSIVATTHTPLVAVVASIAVPDSPTAIDTCCAAVAVPVVSMTPPGSISKSDGLEG